MQWIEMMASNIRHNMIYNIIIYLLYKLYSYLYYVQLLCTHTNTHTHTHSHIQTHTQTHTHTHSPLHRFAANTATSPASLAGTIKTPWFETPWKSWLTLLRKYAIVTTFWTRFVYVSLINPFLLCLLRLYLVLNLGAEIAVYIYSLNC